VLLVIAWSLSVSSIAYCSFVKVKNNTLGDGEQLLGLFKFDSPASTSSVTDSNGSGTYCARYDDESFNRVFNSAGRGARAFGVLATLLAGLALFLDMAMELFWEWAITTIWKICAVLLSLASLFQTLTFLVLLVEPCKIDNVDCTLGATGILSAISVLFFLLSAIMMGCIRPPTKPYFPISSMRNRHSIKLRYVGICGHFSVMNLSAQL